MATISTHYDGEAGERYAQHYASSHHLLTPFKVAKFAPFVRPDDRVLDFGCGSGGVLAGLECKTKTGIEPLVPRAFETMRQGIPVHPDLSSLGDNSFDLVISHHALEHAVEPFRELRELHRVAAPDGRLVLVVPIDDWRKWRQYDPNEINHHLYTWTPQNLGHLLTEAGWTVQAIEVRTWAIPLPSRPAIWQVLRSCLPGAVFDRVCKTYGVLLRRREVLAVARKLCVSP